MENRAETPENRIGPGTLQVKIQRFLNPSTRSICNFGSPWMAPTEMRTGEEVFRTLAGLRSNHYFMSSDGEGCRHWWYVLVGILICLC